MELVIELQLYFYRSCVCKANYFWPNIYTSHNIAYWFDLVMLFEMFNECLFSIHCHRRRRRQHHAIYLSRLMVFQEQFTCSSTTTQVAIERTKVKTAGILREDWLLSNICEEPSRREMVQQKLKLWKTDANPLLDVACCHLRLRPRGVIPMSNGANIIPDQIIPFRYGFYNSLSWERTSYTTVT